MSPRLLTANDVDAYVAIRREMLEDAPWAFSASPGHDRAGDPEAVRAALGQPENAILAVFSDRESPTSGGEARILATAGVRREDRPKHRHIATIWGVYVTPAARGRGLGRDVVAAAVETASGWPGVTCVKLSASENSPGAIRVYESLGFVAWGLEPDALRVNGRSYGEVHMHLALVRDGDEPPKDCRQRPSRGRP